MDTLTDKWDEILLSVKEEYEIADISFKTWLKPLEVFSVEDNGPGIKPEDFQAALEAKSKRYGISNVQQRIQAAYGPEYGMRIDPNNPLGTKVIVEIPKTLKKTDMNR